jgi:peptide deformylase
MHTEPIIQLGNPILRKESLPIPESSFGTSALQDLAQLLIRTMHHENGIGLAAPQIGLNQRAIVFGLDNAGHRGDIPQTILFNPSFRPLQDTLVEDYEGCLSLGNIRAKVPRYQSIYFTGRDVEGNYIEKEVSDFHARVFQHEFDHLNGVVFLDRVTDHRSLGFHEELIKAGVFGVRE